VNGSIQISLASASLAAGTHNVVVYYANGDSQPRSMKMTVGAVSQVVSFPSTGTWDTPSMVLLSAGGFVQGTSNKVLFSINNGAAAPDLDWIEVQ
jgi:alpha-galactosidase